MARWCFLQHLNLFSVLLCFHLFANKKYKTPCNRQKKHTNCDVSLSSILGSTGKGAAQNAPKPWWAYKGAKQSEKAGMQAHPVGEPDGWGGKYVSGGYEIDGQLFPLPGADWFSFL